MQLARHFELTSVSIVRTEVTANILRTMKIPDALVIAEESLLQQQTPLSEVLSRQLPNGCIRLALNAVGGDSAVSLARCLSEGGLHITYGSLGPQSFEVPIALLVYHDISFRGFDLNAWLTRQSPAAMARMWKLLVTLTHKGDLSVPIDQTYPLSEVVPAVKHAMSDERIGKVLFKISE